MRLISYRYEDSIKIIKQRYYCAQKTRLCSYEGLGPKGHVISMHAH